MEIHLSAPGTDVEVHVHLARRDERWVAVARHRRERLIGIAPTPHGALAASISSLGPPTVAALLADPRLMAPSAAVTGTTGSAAGQGWSVRRGRAPG